MGSKGAGGVGYDGRSCIEVQKMEYLDDEDVDQLAYCAV